MGSQETRELGEGILSPSIVEADQRRASDTNPLPSPRNTQPVKPAGAERPPTAHSKRSGKPPKGEYPPSAPLDKSMLNAHPRSLSLSNTIEQPSSQPKTGRLESGTPTAVNKPATPAAPPKEKSHKRSRIALKETPASASPSTETQSHSPTSEPKTNPSSATDMQRVNRPAREMTVQDFDDAYGNIFGFSACPEPPLETPLPKRKPALSKPPPTASPAMNPEDKTHAKSQTQTPAKPRQTSRARQTVSAAPTRAMPMPYEGLPTRTPPHQLSAGLGAPFARMAPGPVLTEVHSPPPGVVGPVMLLGGSASRTGFFDADTGTSLGTNAFTYGLSHEQADSLYGVHLGLSTGSGHLRTSTADASYQTSEYGVYETVDSAGQHVYGRHSSLESMGLGSLEEEDEDDDEDEGEDGGVTGGAAAPADEPQRNVRDGAYPSSSGAHAHAHPQAASAPQPHRMMMASVAPTQRPSPYSPHNRVPEPLARLSLNGNVAFPAVNGATGPWSYGMSIRGGPTQAGGLAARRATLPATAGLCAPPVALNGLAGRRRATATVPTLTGSTSMPAPPLTAAVTMPQMPAMGMCDARFPSTPHSALSRRRAPSNRGPQPDISHPDPAPDALIDDAPTTAELEATLGFSLRLARWVDSPALDD